MRSWQEHAAAFDDLGVVRVGLSSDTVEQAKAMHEKHGFDVLLLSDADLAVTKQLHLEYEDGKTPIPTTILVGPDGRVLWIDVSPNYRKRTDGAAVLAAVRTALADAPAPQAEAVAPGALELVLVQPGEREIDLIKEVRALTGLGLADAKALVDGAPSVLATGLTREDADVLAARFTAVGATVEIR